MNENSEEPDSNILVVDVDANAEAEFLAGLPNRGQLIRYQTHTPSNRTGGLTRLQLAYIENQDPDPESVLAMAGVQSAVRTPLASARQHVRVALNERNPHADFFEDQLLQVGNMYAGEIAVTSNPVVANAIQSYARATPDLLTAKKVNPPFVKSPVAFDAMGEISDGPETAIEAQRVVLEAQCSIALGSANATLSRLKEAGYQISSHSLQPTDSQDMALLTIVLHDCSDKRHSVQKATFEMINTMGVYSVREVSERSKVQYIQGVIHGTREDVHAYLSTMRHVLRDCGAHLRLRQSSKTEDSHLVTGHGPLAIVAGIAGDLQENGVWEKNAPMSLSSGKVLPSTPPPRRNAIASAMPVRNAGPSNADERFRHDFGEDVYREYRASLDEWLKKTIAEHTA
jgi:hypothetical protein